ncbi:MAG: NADPH-dependent assimilatory sulfite reductase hemoprotein subunit [Candidatus Hinthialibacter antarcticus]|nr:NADPH-dependent assimilatory sulfite reductase hemoprotein subunit [Candidatus Hinthialibacter antarcticus]
MSVEDIKKESKRLRGGINQTLAGSVDHFEEDDYQLLKFHGIYQQDNRDARVERRKQGLDREHIFMVRSRIPGGQVTAKQYLIHDEVVGKFGNGSLRITSRQGLQVHFVVKGELKDCVHAINESGITTWGACGDVVRNVMGASSPIQDAAHQDIWKLSSELAETFKSHSQAYSEIWLNGEKLDTPGSEDEPIYGEFYLPRKFKFGVAVPPRNDTDLYTNDVGLAPHVENGAVVGYTLIVGGGMGMSHAKKNTRPILGKPMFYIERAHVVDLCKAIVLTQRDLGNREDRKQARMKYLVEKLGVEAFKKEVVSRLDDGIQVSEPKPLVWNTTGDLLGWNEQGDGKLFLGLWVPEGRIIDSDEGNYRSAIRAIVETYSTPVRLTPNCNIIFCDVDPKHKDAINALLKEHNVTLDDSFSEARRLGMACVSLPTCGLALAESERVFQGVLDEIDVHLRELGLDQDPILIRMTGCPNGCARPYNADIAFVGKSPGKYVVFVGGSHRGDRLAALDKKMADIKDIPGLVRGYLDEYVSNRNEGECFSDYWGRAHVKDANPSPEQFHQEPASN